MANKFIIEVRAKGFGDLSRQLDKSGKAMGDFDTRAGRLRGTTSGLRRTIGSLRNTILLYTFAAAAAAKATGTFVRNAAKFESLRTRLVGLTGSVEAAEKAFSNFNAVAATTPFSLDDVVNAGAQLQAFGADANALIKPVTDLAAFMGTTATEAANALGRAFAGGAGASEILRERGILALVKSSQGITDLAKTTLPEFRKALINSLQDPVVGIAGSTDRMSKTFEGASSNMKDAFTRLTAAAGDTLINTLKLKDNMIAIGEVAESIAKKINFFNDPIANLTERVKALNLETEKLEGIGLVLDTKATQEAIAEEDESIRKLATSFAKLEEMSDIFEFVGASYNRNLGTFIGGNFKLVSDFDILGERAKDAFTRISEEIENTTDLNKMEVLVSQLEGLRKLMGLLQTDSANMRPNQKGFFEQMFSDEVDMLGDMTVFDPFESFMKDLRDEAMDEADAFVKAQQEKIDALAELKDFVIDMASLEADSESKLIDEAEMRRDLMNLRKRDLAQEKEALQQRANGFKQFSDNIGEAVVQGQSLGEAVTNSLKSIAAQIAAEAVSFMILSMITGGGFSASKAGFNILGSIIGHKGGAITNKGIQRFAMGGMVQGPDNVPILAQSGEFIMNREATQSIGLDTLQAMNDTGSPTSTVNVTIQGGVVQEDYVRNKLIPALEKQGANLA